jgi:hypothetical protein
MDSSSDQKEQIRQQLRQAALEYHEYPTPGKISVTPTKQLTNQRDLALAYSQVWRLRARKSLLIRPPHLSTPRAAIWSV